MSNRLWPKVSIVTPTLNASSVLVPYFEAIKTQTYPQDKIEILICDGGSTDATIDIAKKYGAWIYPNKLRTSESGKAVGVNLASGEYILLLDSDNIMPTQDWLEQMIAPLEDNLFAVGSEPWAYTWRKEDSFITRYSALIGMNDPMIHFIGNYDRLNLLSGKWTEVAYESMETNNYIIATFNNFNIPTIGANGTVFRAKFLKDNLKGDYLFDIDILYSYIKNNGSVSFIKVKNGIVHTFCEGNIFKFARKQRRRVKDFLYHQYKVGDRDIDWNFTGDKKMGYIKFIVSCVLVFPLIYQSIKGYIKKPDIAWFFHPLACEITLWEYGWGVIFGIFKKEEINRKNWKQ